MAALDSSLELDQVLRMALATILDALGPGHAGMILVDDWRHPGYQVAAHRGKSQADLPRRVFLDDCPCRNSLEIGLPLVTSTSANCLCQSGLSTGGEHKHLAIPLKSTQIPVGLLCVLCPPTSQPDTWDLSLWEDIGIQIGRAIADAQVQAQVQQERELLQTLYDVSNHLATSLDLDWVLSRVLDLSVSATDASDGSVFLLPRPSGSSARILRRDLPPAQADEVIGQVLEQGVAGWVVRHKEGAIVYDTARDSRWLAFSDDPSHVGSALAVPLMAEGRVLGVLTLDHTEPNHFHSRHIALMMAIAHQAATAIEKARLHNEVTHLADVLAERVEERTRELKKTQAQLIQAEKLAALGELAAGIAHEINNPLHILRAYLEYMASQAQPGDSFLEFLEPMQNALENITRLAGQLRDFSRPASGEWKPLDLNQAVDNVLRLVRKELMHYNIEAEQSLGSYLPEVKGDIRQLEQVFLNLVLNARDAMPGGGRLTIETRADTDAVYAIFADTGVGIKDENLNRIFEPYFTTKEDRGTGLGLAICHRVVTQHGGRITVSSQLGVGTTFTVQLPIPGPGMMAKE
jgi:signal transduction histidine kinase